VWDVTSVTDVVEWVPLGDERVEWALAIRWRAAECDV
jgi:hypothetical protein